MGETVNQKVVIWARGKMGQRGPTTTTTNKPMKHAGGSMKPAKVITTVEVTISGSVWAYHPTPK
jgi:hypothetical protein